MRLPRSRAGAHPHAGSHRGARSRAGAGAGAGLVVLLVLLPSAAGCGNTGGLRASGTDTEMVVVRDAHVETNRRRLERVLGNLVANAHKHGRGPVVMTVNGPVVTVRNHGDGYPQYLLDGGPQRFRSGGGGHGLGLTIAAGQAEAIGARLEFRAAPGGGALAVLTLPASPAPPAS